MTEDCTFCKIIQGELPSYKIYDDDYVIAFLDHHPVSKGHTLVVPKEHIETIYDANDMPYIWDAIVKIANAIDKTLSPDGMNVNQNNGKVAGQEIFHLHSHLIPRYKGDETDLYQDPQYNRAELENPDELVDEISNRIED